LAGGGVPATTLEVDWQVAADERFQRVVAAGTAGARPELGHSVHVEVGALRPARWYWYRFRVGGHLSPVGRTRTTPAQGVLPGRVTFGLASCQDYASGYYTAHRHMADEDLDAVVHVGDYIYERPPDPNTVRRHEGDGEPVTLEQYRNRHAQYRTDADLQACHAMFPWLVVLDDHELANNWADDTPQSPDPRQRPGFRSRRRAALQAYYEHMPLRRNSIPRGIHVALYRRVRFGDLLDVHLLDTRQYRSDQNLRRRCDRSRTILGDTQRRWLLTNLAASTAQWNALAQQVVFSQLDYATGPNQAFNDDAWDGYAADRDTLRRVSPGSVEASRMRSGDARDTSEVRPRVP
jgi:alkaline phosphatase D